MTRTLALVLFLTPLLTHAEVLFEAFYRIEKQGRHSGYVIQRLSRDAKGTQTVRTYVRSRRLNGEAFSTSKSIARTGSGQPVETQHLSTFTGVPYKIEGKFKNGQGTVSYFSNHARKAGLKETVKTVPYPSAFLFYTADLTKFKPENRYSYNAFFEESGRTQIGFLSLLAAKESGAKRILQILNDDSGQPMENFVSESGMPLGSRSHASNTVVYWVASKEEAVGEFSYPTAEIIALFNDLPAGKKNPWSSVSKFKAFDVIQSFPLWESGRQVSTAVNTVTLPVRK